jgi:uncharacterized protein (TIGR00255 family)
MTGHGECMRESDALSTVVEVRSVNNRHLKMVFRADEALACLEGEVEKVLRETVKRGSLTVTFKCKRTKPAQALATQSLIDGSLLQNYIRQTREATGMVGSGEILAASCLHLPGVVLAANQSGSVSVDEEWPQWEATLREALAKFQAMRLREGAAMARELMSLHRLIQVEARAVAERAPEVVKLHREKLRTRLEAAFSQSGMERHVEPHEILRETALLAERLDISEEVVRLGSHLDQFARFVEHEESPGRKFDFLIQEMLRETNTIGSKASDLEIAHRVVEIKGLLERIRELVQNVE